MPLLQPDADGHCVVVARTVKDAQLVGANEAVGLRLELPVELVVGELGGVAGAGAEGGGELEGVRRPVALLLITLLLEKLPEAQAVELTALLALGGSVGVGALEGAPEAVVEPLKLALLVLHGDATLVTLAPPLVEGAPVAHAVALAEAQPLPKVVALLRPDAEPQDV